MKEKKRTFPCRKNGPQNKKWAQNWVQTQNEEFRGMDVKTSDKKEAKVGGTVTSASLK